MTITRVAVIQQPDGVPRHVSPTDNRGTLRHTASWLRPPAPRGHINQDAIAGHTSVYGKACAWIAPWGAGNYPGHRATIQAILGTRHNVRTLLRWKQDDRPPASVARRLASYIRTRAMAGLALAEALDAYAATREAEPPPEARLRKRKVRDV